MIIMRVCVIGTRGFPNIEGGVEKHCESLYPLLNRNIEVVVFRRRPFIESNNTYENTKFIDLPSTKIKGVEALIHSFLATICSIFLRPDIIHYHNIGPAIFAPLARLFHIRVILTYHSPNYEHEKWGAAAKKMLLCAEKVSLKFADKVIFVNKYQMLKYSPEIACRSIFMPNGIQKPIFSQKIDYLERISVQQKKYILGVGRVTPEKGFDTLIKAYNTFGLVDYKLVIAGSYEREKSYKMQLDEMTDKKDVIFTGYVYGEELAQLYTNAALFVIASNNEGFPMVLLEAMSYQLAILASDIPATHMVRLEDNVYFKKGDYIELGKKIENKLKHCTSALYDMTEYSWNDIASRVGDIYSQVLSN